MGGRLDEEEIFKRGGEECKERKENFVDAEDTCHVFVFVRPSTLPNFVPSSATNDTLELARMKVFW